MAKYKQTRKNIDLSNVDGEELLKRLNTTKTTNKMNRIVIEIPDGLDVSDVLRDNFPEFSREMEDEGLFNEMCGVLEYWTEG